MTCSSKGRWATFLLLVVTLLLSACRGNVTSNPNTIEFHPDLKNIPVYPEAKGWVPGVPGVDTPQGYDVYSYPAEVLQSKTLVGFYKENMPPNGWELFSEMENEIGNIESITLLFSKGNTIAELGIMEWTTTSWLVTVNFYDE